MSAGPVCDLRLLVRNTLGVAPTEYGRALLDGGVAAFDDLRQAVKKIEFLADPMAGEIRIGCTPILAATFAPAVVDRLSRRYPRIVFHFVTAYLEPLRHELSERNLDLLIVRKFAPTADEPVDFESLFDDSYVVAAGAKINGLGGGGSNLPNSRANRGRCRRGRA